MRTHCRDRERPCVIPPFSFRFDPAIGAVCVTLSGRWSMQTAHDYTQAVTNLVRSAPPGTTPRKALYDLRDCDLHTREVSEMLAAFHASVTPDMDRVAFIGASTLEGLQAKRISSGRECRVFPSAEEARAWLAEV